MNSIWGRIPARARLAAIVTATVLLALGVGAAILATGGSRDRATRLATSAAELGLTLKPSAEGPEGIPAGAHFLMTSQRDLDAAGVKQALRLSPEVTLDVSEKSAREFELTPWQALEQGVVYRFEFAEPGSTAVLASWAFEVRGPLRVVQTLPADEASGVPIDSGIEVTFSHDGVQDPQSLVEITPALDGHWEQHKRTAVFVPRELAPETLYTVRLKPGASVPGTDLRIDSDFTFRFETGDSKRGGGNPPAVFDFLHKVGEWGTKDAPLLSIYTSDSGLQELAFDVFAYPSADAFITDLQAREDIAYWARFSRDRKTVDTSNLAPVLAFKAAIEGPRQQNQGFFAAQGQLFVRLPQALAPGYYLVQTQYRGAPVQAWLQVTDIATYLAVSETSTLVWVNDVSKGAPVQGAAVRLNGQASLGSTDAQGISQFDTPKEMVSVTTDQYNQRRETGKGYLTVTDPSGRVAIVPVSPVVSTYLPSGRDGSFTEGSYTFSGYDYWDYAITDRPVYQPDDTVHFWGIALPREGGAESSLTAQLIGYPADGTGQVMYPDRVSLKTTDWGTFTGEFPLKGAAEGYHNINFSGPDGFITGVSFQVARYVKPAYKIDVIPSKLAVLVDEPVDVTITASFFDGTPIPGLKLKYDAIGSGDLTTDADGNASFSFRATLKDQINGGTVPVTVAPSTPEEGEISGQAFVRVFLASIRLSATSSYADGQVTVSGVANRIDPSRFTGSGDDYAYDAGRGPKPPYYLDGVPGKTLTAEVTEQIWDAVETGETYDFINKVSRKVYRYQQRSGATFTTTAVTGADGSFKLSFLAKDGSSYQVRLTAPDDRDRTAVYLVYAYGRTSTFDLGGLAYISTSNDESNAPFFNSQTLELGDKSTATFRRGKDEPPSGANNRYLFYEGQRGIRHYEVQDNPRYQVTFGDRHVPSSVIGGVYFNGFTYIEAQYGPTLTFNPRNRNLKIEVKSLKEAYEPGDEATLEVSVTDASGKPVQAEVNLSAVDEAVFAVADFYDYQQEILPQLYRALPSGIIRTYASHQYPPEFLEPGGRGGGGGGRTDFLDVAYFGTVRTDGAGKARVSFKLPDNLTSWRVTAYGFTKDIKAGRGAGSVVASLPFSVDVSVNADYLEGDAPLVRLRAFGSALKSGDKVEFNLSAPSLGGGADISASGAAFSETLVTLPKLTAGSHEITVKARSGQSEDSVVRGFEVVAARTEVSQLTLYDKVDSSTKFDATGGRSTVTFLDAGRGQYYRLLANLRWAFGDRVDQALARVVAAQLLSDFFGEPAEAPAFEPSPYLKVGNPGANPRIRKGGIAILPYADSDLAVTARIANLAPDLFGRETLRRALRAVVDDRNETSERTAIALYGLAGLGEPVLVDLTAAGRDPQLGWRGRLYAGLGLHALGDDAGASTVLAGLVKDYGEDAKPWFRLRVGVNQDDSMEATALAAVLAAGVGDQRAESMLRYVQENCTSEHLLYLDELQYLKGILPRTNAANVEFSYTSAGQTRNEVLEKGRTRSVSLSAGELKDLKIKLSQGSLAVAVRSAAPLSAQAPASPDLKITRTLKSGGQPATATIPAAGVVEVTLQFSFSGQAPDGCYQVTDVVPSGLKVVTQPGYVQALQAPPFFRPNTVFPYLAESQKISFCVGKAQSSVTYYARPSEKGEFTWEPALLQNMRAPGLIAFSASQRITVK